MENNNSAQEIIKNCIQIINKSDTYEDGVRKICGVYGVSFEDIFVPEKERISTDVEKETTDALCDKLGFANNQAGAVRLFTELDEGIQSINTDLVIGNIARTTGEMSRNPQLHGFVFEEIHAAVFNMRARLAGKPYVARVLKPLQGERYAKNSVDIIIRNTKLNKDVQRYQLKCCKSAKETIEAIKSGQYNSQRILVPAEQLEEVRKAFPNKTVVPFLEIAGVKSNKVEYPKAIQIRDALQSGNWESIKFDEFSGRDIFYAGVQNLKTPVLANAVMRTAVGAGAKVIGQSDTSWKEITKDVGKGVVDDTTKLSLTTGVQVYIKKKLANTVLNKLKPSSIFSAVSVLVDTAKEIGQVAKGEKSAGQATENIAKKTVVAVAQGAAGAGGATLGALFGGVGALAGGITCSTAAGVAAEKLCDTVADIAKNERYSFKQKEDTMMADKAKNNEIKIKELKDTIRKPADKGIAKHVNKPMVN